MDDKPVKSLPEAILKGYDLLLSKHIVQITQALEWSEKEKDGNGWVFKFNIKVEEPNKANLPHVIKIKCLIRESYPYVPIIFYSEEKTLQGFPHQDSATGKICLSGEDSFPMDDTRLLEYVRAADNWVVEAANETLFQIGEPYELPDFNSLCLIAARQLLFDESNQSFENWKNYIGQTGIVMAKTTPKIPGLFTTDFFAENGSLIWESRFKQDYLSNEQEIQGSWILIPDIRYYRHRPPQTFKELKEICKKFDINFTEILKKTWKFDNRKACFIIVGFPIPINLGEESNEIHWQAMYFDSLKEFKRTNRNPIKSRKPSKIWEHLSSEGCYSNDKKLPWVSSVNISKKRLISRGGNPKPFSALNVSIFGCGALGSSVSEILFKGGLERLSLFDNDALQYGNLCRHYLDASYLNMNKAIALADRLNMSSPFTEVTGFNIKVPEGLQNDLIALRELNESNLIIDCTTSLSAAEWLSIYSCEHRIKMATMFFDFGAEYLTLYISSDNTSTTAIFKDITEIISQTSSPIPKEYSYQPKKTDQVLEGAGCWHPTFPASHAHIQILSANGVNILLNHFKTDSKKGFAAIIRRNSSLSGETPLSLTEIVWTKIYP